MALPREPVVGRALPGRKVARRLAGLVARGLRPWVPPLVRGRAGLALRVVRVVSPAPLAPRRACPRGGGALGAGAAGGRGNPFGNPFGGAGPPPKAKPGNPFG